MHSPEIHAQLQKLRARIVDGSGTKDDVREFIRHTREGRIASQSAPQSKGKSKTPVNTAALFDELKNL